MCRDDDDYDDRLRAGFEMLQDDEVVDEDALEQIPDHLNTRIDTRGPSPRHD